MTAFEWISIVMACLVAIVGFLGWLIHVSICLGKMLGELRSIDDKLSGHFEWLKTIDSKVDDHEKRITRLEV